MAGVGPWHDSIWPYQKGLTAMAIGGSLPTVPGIFLAKQYCERLLSVNFAPPGYQPRGFSLAMA